MTGLGGLNKSKHGVVIGLVAVPYPVLPRHFTLISAFAIGIPAFFLALAPNDRRYFPGFVGRVLRFAGPAGLPRPIVERDGNLIMVDDDRLPLRPGEQPQLRTVRFRTLGCYPFSGAVESTANTLPAIIQEMLLARTSERQGRMIDYDEAGSMEQKKKEGYF